MSVRDTCVGRRRACSPPRLAPSMFSAFRGVSRLFTASAARGRVLPPAPPGKLFPTPTAHRAPRATAHHARRARSHAAAHCRCLRLSATECQVRIYDALSTQLFDDNSRLPSSAGGWSEESRDHNLMQHEFAAPALRKAFAYIALPPQNLRARGFGDFPNTRRRTTFRSHSLTTSLSMDGSALMFSLRPNGAGPSTRRRFALSSN